MAVLNQCKLLTFVQDNFMKLMQIINLTDAKFYLFSRSNLFKNNFLYEQSLSISHMRSKRSSYSEMVKRSSLSRLPYVASLPGAISKIYSRNRFKLKI